MELFFRITLFIAGVINFLPSLLAFFPNKISKTYGIEITNPNLELVVRHRAILFGIIGLLIIFSSVTKKYYELSLAVGFISMVSFIVFYFLIGNINSELKKVFLVDVIGVIILLFGSLLYYFSIKS